LRRGRERLHIGDSFTISTSSVTTRHDAETMSELRFHAHACTSLEADGQVMLADPWFDGEIFNRSWALRVKPDLSRIPFDRVRWVWVSHEHPDHFHLPSLRTIRERVSGPLTLLYRKQENPNVKRAARSLGYDVVELSPGVRTPVWGDVALTSFPFGTDTMVVIEADGRVILNQNDCRADAATIKSVRSRHPHIDAWLFYFSIAGYHGNADERARLAAAHDARLAELTRYFDLVRPRTFVPFASFIVFCREANDYLNEFSVTVDDVLGRCAGLPVLVLWDGDTVLWDGWAARNALNAERWRAAWSIPRMPLPARPVADADLVSAGAAMVAELELYPDRLRMHAPRECHVLLRGRGRAAMLDLRGARFGLLEQAEAQVVAELDAEDLLFLLRFPWGADTLYISSCFVVRDAARWNELIAFRHGMYTTHLTSRDRLKMAVKRADRALLGGSLLRWARNRPPPGSATH
jgi:L-ascorbate metabolism protein UlaG (beta-lactamase superfamily)